MEKQLLSHFLYLFDTTLLTNSQIQTELERAIQAGTSRSSRRPQPPQVTGQIVAAEVPSALRAWLEEAVRLSRSSHGSNDEAHHSILREQFNSIVLESIDLVVAQSKHMDDTATNVAVARQTLEFIDSAFSHYGELSAWWKACERSRWRTVAPVGSVCYAAEL